MLRKSNTGLIALLVFYLRVMYDSAMAQYMIEDAEVPDGVELFDPADYESERDRIMSTIKDTLVKQFPKEYNGVRMELKDVDYDKKQNFTLAEQKKALHSDDYLGWKLKGTVRLVDNATGQVLDEKKMTLLKAPWLTSRHTFIREGNEWGTIAQQRLLPGAYSRVQNNGNLETQFNVRPGTGAAFKVQFNPETAQYKLTIGGAEVHLYSLLKDMGVDDSVMAERWGDSILQVNASKYDARTLDKAYNKIVPAWDRDKSPNRTREEKAFLIERALNRAQVASSVVARTLPNMNNKTKAANWKSFGEAMEKTAAMTRSELQDLATYINYSAGKNIDTEGTKEALKSDILNTIASGMPDGNLTTGDIDMSDAAAALVRQNKMKRIVAQINKMKKKPTISL